MEKLYQIPQLNHLELYFVIAEDLAKQSPCLRRQYGAVIAYSGYDGELGGYQGGYNQRVGKCCGGDSCARTRFQISHGQRVEVGGEIHAETAALINGGRRTNYSLAYFILRGFANGKELLGNDVRPCHSCAMQIKYAGFSNIYIKAADGQIIPVNISQVIEEREAEWEPADA